MGTAIPFSISFPLNSLATALRAELEPVQGGPLAWLVQRASCRRSAHSVMRLSPFSQTSRTLAPGLQASMTAARVPATRGERNGSHPVRHCLLLCVDECQRQRPGGHSLLTILAAALYLVTTSGLCRVSSSCSVRVSASPS